MFPDVYIQGRIRAQCELPYPIAEEAERELALYVTDTRVENIAAELRRKWLEQQDMPVGDFLLNEFRAFP